MDQIHNSDYDNLDLTKVMIKTPENIKEIYNLKLDTKDTVSTKSNKDYINDFINQLKLFFPKESINEEYIHFQANGYYELNDAYPALNDYRQKAPNDTIKINMLDYRSPNVYLCNFKHDVTIPQRMNKGTGARLSLTEDEYKEAPDFWLGTWTTDKYTTEIERFVNNGAHNTDTYLISGENVSIGDAIEFFENKFYQTLPFKYSEDVKLNVSEVGIVQFSDDSYGYNFYATISYNDMSFDRADVGFVDGLNDYKFFTFQAFMIEKGSIDFMYGMPTDMTIEEIGDSITEIISVDDAIAIASDTLTKGVVFEVDKIECIYQMKSEENTTSEYPYPNMIAEPAWKLSCYNNNDQKNYMVHNPY